MDYHMLRRLESLGISYEDATALRRISMTLHRWHELECGTDSGAIERDEKTGKTFWLGDGTYRFKTPDRETGALRRLATIMARYPSLAYYVQGDPRGAALYIGSPEQMTDSRYSQGVAVYK